MKLNIYSQGYVSPCIFSFSISRLCQVGGVDQNWEVGCKEIHHMDKDRGR